MAPASVSAISPFFIVNNVDETIAFYRDKLGFETRLREPEEGPFFGIVGRDGAQIFIKSHSHAQPVPNHTRHPYMAWDAFVYVPDPDALAAEFSASAVTFHKPLQDTHDGLRGFEIADPNGYILFFGCPIPEVRHAGGA